jgi:hypothetical protein
MRDDYSNDGRLVTLSGTELSMSALAVLGQQLAEKWGLTPISRR